VSWGRSALTQAAGRLSWPSSSWSSAASKSTVIVALRAPPLPRLVAMIVMVTMSPGRAPVFGSARWTTVTLAGLCSG
jgi:hypothetical protein